MLYALKRRYSHWPDGRPIDAIFQHSLRSWYYELTDKNNKSTPYNIKCFIKACGVDSFEYLFTNNLKLLSGKLDNLDGLQMKGNRFADLDFRQCSMKGTRFEPGTLSITIAFFGCQFTAEQFDQAQLKGVEFSGCTFEGKAFSSQVLENAKFYVTNSSSSNFIRSNAIMTEAHRHQLSEIINLSCLKAGTTADMPEELDTKRWLKVMINSRFLCQPKKDSPLLLDNKTRQTLEQQLPVIKKQHSQLLSELVNALIPLKFYGGTAEATAFIRNNPRLPSKKVDSLGVLTFQEWNNSDNHPEELKKYVEPKVIKAWLAHYPDYSLDCTKSANVSSDNGGYDSKFSYLMIHYPEAVPGCAKEIEQKARKMAEKYTYFNAFVYNALVYLAKKRQMSPKQETFWLNRLITRELFPDLAGLLRYREGFLNFWQQCHQDEHKLEVAKTLITESNTLVGYKATIELFKHLVTQGESGAFLDGFIENLHSHAGSEHLGGYSRNGCEHLRKALENLEQWLEKEHPSMLVPWKEKSQTLMQMILKPS